MSGAEVQQPLSPEADLHYDPFLFYDDPYPVYRRLRTEAPLYHNPERELWVLSRFDDVQTVARDWRAFRSAPGVVLDDESDFYAPGGFVDQDPPLHDRLREVMAPYFSPKNIREFEQTVRDTTRELLRPFVEEGEVDIAAELARPLPTRVICSWLGFPAEDHPLLTEWFAAMLARVPGQIDAPQSAWDANKAMRDYIADAARDRETTPREDLMTALVAGERDGRLSHNEVIGMAIFLFYAGIISTAGLISNSLLNLPRFPDQWHLLGRDPSLVPAAVEELLRHEAPIQSLSRITQEEASFHGETVPAESRVLLVWASANRDEQRWDDPDRIDVMRTRKRHLAFGEGIHHCIGAPLARLEGKVAFEELLAVMPEFELLGDYRRIYTPHERGLESLRVGFTPVSPPWLA